MPDNKMIQKAGKITFLLVCLFLCTACRSEKAVFESGELPKKVQKEETKIIELEEEDKIPVTVTLVNINTADEAELMTLPGIGKVRAAAIIEYREQTGKYEKIEDIMNVKGIKTGIFSKINSLICVK